MPFLGPDHYEQLANFDEGRKARHRVIVLRLIGVGWNEAAASFLAVERVMEEDAMGRSNAVKSPEKSQSPPLTGESIIVEYSTLISTNTDVAPITPIGG